MDENFRKEILKGNINIAILKALEEGDKYGYEIGKYIEAKVGGDFKLKEPTLYSCLKRLESRKLIESYWSDEDSHGGRRKYFRLTDYGKRVCSSNITDWRKSKAIIDNILSGDDNRGPHVPFKDEKSASPSPADSGNPLTANNTRFLRSEKMFSNDDEEINPEYRTILSKLLKNVKNEIDISVNRSSGEDDNAEKTPDRESFFDRSYFEDNRIRDRIKESDNDRSKENDLSFTRQNISDSDEDKAYLLDKSEVLLDEKQGEDYSLLPSSSAFRLGSFVAIQRTMASQGFTLKPYSPDNSSPKQFLLLNRINMVAALLLFLVAAIQTAAIYYFWEPIIGIGLKYYVYILTAMLIVPIVSSLVYLFNPYKRTKKRYNVFYSIISSIMMFIVCFLGILSIALLFKIDVNNQYEMILKLYIPTIYASNFVFYSVIWAILYKTGSCRY